MHAVWFMKDRPKILISSPFDRHTDKWTDYHVLKFWYCPVYLVPYKTYCVQACEGRETDCQSKRGRNNITPPSGGASLCVKSSTWRIRRMEWTTDGSWIPCPPRRGYRLSSRPPSRTPNQKAIRHSLNPPSEYRMGQHQIFICLILLTLYMVTVVDAYLGWVDLDLGCSTLLLGSRYLQKRPSSSTNLSQPNPDA